MDEWAKTDRVMARYAPVSLIALPGVWIATVILAFTPMFWALGSTFPRESFTRSGSSLLTLGFAYAHDGPETVLTFVGGHDRARPGRPPHLLPPVDLRRLLPP